jgi:type I restriction enzyme R subunit
VHFAVSNSEIHMTTQLAGPATVFLPFNKGDHGAKGNPPNPAGHRTSYLWEEVWQRDSWLEIIGRYLVTRRDDKKKITAITFPRYHQLDATRKLQAKVLEEGAGGKFLIQHSAGSGKTNSIAWSAHFLADLHDAKNEKLFSTVIVISDRNVIDAQLQDPPASLPRSSPREPARAVSSRRRLRRARRSSFAPSRPSRLHWRRSGSSRPPRASGSL